TVARPNHRSNRVRVGYTVCRRARGAMRNWVVHHPLREHTAVSETSHRATMYRHHGATTMPMNANGTVTASATQFQNAMTLSPQKYQPTCRPARTAHDQIPSIT